MNKSYTWLLLPGMFAMSANAIAAEEEEKKSPWTSSAELGYVRTTGNTETQTTSLKINAVYEVEKWRHTGRTEGFGQKSQDSTTGESVVSAERYELFGKSDYKFNEHDYAFGLVRLRKDRFSGFEYENIISAGYGRKVLKQDNMELDLEIGPGMRFFKVDNGTSEDEALLRLAGNYWWAITDTSRFTQELSTDIGEDITSSQSITGIQANINSTLALRFTYTIRHKSKVPVGTEKTDTETAISMVYTF